MGLFDRTLPGEALQDMLDRERQAVLGGRFDVLERMATEKDRLVRAVVLQSPDLETLRRLRANTERNNRLLEAMRAGVQAARARLDAMRHPVTELSTYDASGRKSAICGPTTRPAHRA